MKDYATCDDPDERFTVYDNNKQSYQVHLFEDAHGWLIKVYDGDTRVGQVNCLNHGEDLFLADLNIFESATHPIAGLGRLRSWLGFNTHGQIENYQNRGLGLSLLRFVITRAQKQGFQRVIGSLFPKDLKKNSALPDWYRRRGFLVTMATNQLSGKLELVTGDYQNGESFSPASQNFGQSLSVMVDKADA